MDPFKIISLYKFVSDGLCIFLFSALNPYLLGTTSSTWLERSTLDALNLRSTSVAAYEAVLRMISHLEKL